MKKEYQKPALRIVHIEHQQIICGSDAVTKVESGDAGIGYGGGGNGPNRARQHSVWDEDWSEELDE